MQKKSLLVALFCGALCLTGCLKNEESASVTQVRIAKANELNSIADLNKAKAQAEVIYANAEATIANAEAELKKAEAALVLAQAETEKVKAELLKVQVQLAEVKVEEEKVKLQMMQADLESRLAALEAEKAAAEAAKQAWVNVLNDLLAQAEIEAIQNAQNILQAEAELEDYILTLEGAKADSAALYAQLYFQTLDEIEALQLQELQAKAQRVLVNQGAILAREFIHNEIDATNDTIARNEAFIAALKEHQTMTPEEAEAALKEAREAAGEAYAAYLDARNAERDALTAVNEAFEKEADFTQGWGAFNRAVMRAMPRWSRAESYEETTLGEGETERIREVPTVGIRVWSEENGLEFIPFWNEELIDTMAYRYPAADVVAYNHKTLDDIRIVPATIYYDNIQEALNDAVAREEAEAERNIARAQRRMNRQIATLEEEVAEWEDTIALHKAYVEARQADVEKAEKAYKDAIAADKGEDEAVNTAWEAFQLYMLTQHPTVSRSYFINRFVADTQYQNALTQASKDSAAYKSALQDTVKLKGDVKAAFEEYAKARGAVKKAQDSLYTPGTEAYAANQAYEAALLKWNPDFADSEEPADFYGYFNVDETHWFKGSEEAGSAQDTTMNANHNLEVALRAQYAAQIDFWAGIKTAAQKKEADDAVTAARARVARAKGVEDAAWLEYVAAYEALVEAVGGFPQDIYDNYNPEFDVFDYVHFPTDAIPSDAGVDYTINTMSAYWDDEKGDWDFSEMDEEEAPGKAQLDLLYAVKNVLDAREGNAAAEAKFEEDMLKFGQAKTALDNANRALIEAIKGAPMEKGDKIEDYIDDEAEAKYKDYLAAVEKSAKSDVRKALANLWIAYGVYPDEVGSNRPDDYPESFENRSINFGWLISSYMVDPEATFVSFNGEDKSIAELFFGKRTRRNNPYRNSLQWKVDDANNTIEVELPEELAEYTARQNAEVEEFKEQVASIMSVVNSFKSSETGYNNWVAEREAAQENYNEARKETWAAQEVKDEAEAEYDAVRAVADEGVYLYDPDHELDDVIEASRHSRLDRNYIKVSVADQIKILEEENERLEAKNEFLRNVLKDGKKVLAVVNEIIDQKIEQISEQIEIMSAIALKYKEIMNAYLGIVDEEATTETGPLEEEGDEE